MRLTDLEPQFLVVEEPGRLRRYVDTLEIAQGVMFLCPACFVANGGAAGTHQVLCWFSGRGVLDTEEPGPGRWAPEGTGYADLTLGCAPGKSRSVLLLGGCAWHGFVTAGDVTTC